MNSSSLGHGQLPVGQSTTFNKHWHYYSTVLFVCDLHIHFVGKKVAPNTKRGHGPLITKMYDAINTWKRKATRRIKLQKSEST